jgi:hypothetical protein
VPCTCHMQASHAPGQAPCCAALACPFQQGRQGPGEGLHVVPEPSSMCFCAGARARAAPRRKLLVVLLSFGTVPGAEKEVPRRAQPSCAPSLGQAADLQHWELFVASAVPLLALTLVLCVVATMRSGAAWHFVDRCQPADQRVLAGHERCREGAVSGAGPFITSHRAGGVGALAGPCECACCACGDRRWQGRTGPLPRRAGALSCSPLTTATSAALPSGRTSPTPHPSSPRFSSFCVSLSVPAIIQ